MADTAAPVVAKVAEEPVATKTPAPPAPPANMAGDAKLAEEATTNGAPKEQESSPAADTVEPPKEPETEIKDVEMKDAAEPEKTTEPNIGNKRKADDVQVNGTNGTATTNGVAPAAEEKTEKVEEKEMSPELEAAAVKPVSKKQKKTNGAAVEKVVERKSSAAAARNKRVKKDVPVAGKTMRRTRSQGVADGLHL